MLFENIEEILSTIETIGDRNGERIESSVSNEKVNKSKSPEKRSPHGLEIARVYLTFGILIETLRGISSPIICPGSPSPAKLVLISKSPISTSLNGESSNSVSSFEMICISLVNLTPTSVPNSISPSEVRLNSMSLSGSQSFSEESGSRH